MRILDIAFKDLVRSFRNAFAVVMMFIVPLLITGLIYVAFSGLTGGGDGEIDVPVTKVALVNLDGGQAGNALVDFLTSESLNKLLQVIPVDDEAAARAMVDRQETGVAVIIPSGFTTDADTGITLYQDPTLTLGPGIVKETVGQFVDGMSGAHIAADVAGAQLRAHNAEAGPDLVQKIVTQYIAWAQASGQSQSAGAHPEIEVQTPPVKAKTAPASAVPIAPVMTGMLIFFSFFSAGMSAQSILREDEEGTLSRLFTTPASRTVILGGKFVSVFVVCVVQAVVVLAASAILFKINWGDPLIVALLVVGLVVVASGFGILLMAFIRTTRQAGPVLGGVLSVTGMLGGLFTTGFPNLPAAFDSMTLFVPQGWAMRAWKVALGGGSLGDVLVPLGVTLALGALLFGLGVSIFRKRFA
jgi:ABC-2 type transport system permease protein